ncbi:MAG: hypothetical protein IKZ85_07635 [Pseudobutyrivibrio sp.]|nr:hypothetical protein [Pseudobutyrivibrio sp.]
MEKIYENSEQIHVAAVVIYPGTGANSSKYYYTAAEATAAAEDTEIPAEKLFQLFAKGVLVKSGSNYIKPLACTLAGALTLPTLS